MYKDKLVRVSANCCYIGKKDSPLLYKAEHISMLHNFVHFEIDCPEEMERLGLPFDTPFYTDMQEDITTVIEKMEWAKNAQDAMLLPPVENLFEDMLRRLAVERKTLSLSSGYTHEHNFDTLRTQVYLDPGDWNVEKMAEYVYLSRSHFSIKYKDIFGVTPNNDINTAALLVASKLLTTTNYSVSKISKTVGYARSDYFIRLFKQKYGVTPAEYRKFNAINIEEEK